MPTARNRSFIVEPLEARILLSAAPADAGGGAASGGSADGEGVLWHLSEREEDAAEAIGEAAGLFEAMPGGSEKLEEVAFSALATTSYGNGTTVDAALFRSGFTVIESGATHTFQATTGGIFFSGPGTLDGSSPTSVHENIRLVAAGGVEIDGQIGGTSPIHNLVVSAGSNIFFGGSIHLTGDLIIEAGGQVTFSRDVTVLGNLIIGDGADPGAVDGVAFGDGSLVNVGGEIRVHTDGTVDFRNRVGVSIQPSGVTVAAGEAIRVEQDFHADRIDFSAGNVSFDRTVRASGLAGGGTVFRMTAEDLLSFGGRVEIGDGDAILTANRVSFTGGEGSVQSVGAPSSLTIRPFDPNRSIGIGEPTGGDFSRLQITDGELNAIHSGFGEVVFGDLAAGTGEVRVGRIGLAQPTGITQLQNAVTFAGGTVVVESPVDLDKGAAYLRLVARTGDILINGAINESVSERNAWVRLEAEGDVVINRPVFALDRISVTAGYGGGEGSVFVNSLGAASGGLFTTNAGETFTARGIEVVAGETVGDIYFRDEAGETTVSVVGEGGSVVMHAAGGEIVQTAGGLHVETLSLLARDDISIPAADIRVIGETTLAGEVVSSGIDRTIRGIEIRGTGSLHLTALNDLLVQWILTHGGDIDLGTVPTSGDDLEIGSLSAGSGTIRLTADGAILDAAAGLDEVNLATTGAVILLASRGIGGPGVDDLDTDVGRLSARNAVAGGIHIANRRGLEIVDFLETQGGDGSISVTADTGDLSVDATVSADGSGNLLLASLDAALVIRRAVNSGSGHLTLRAHGDLRFLADASAATAGGGTLFLRAETGGIEMEAIAGIRAEEAIRMEAEGDLVLGRVAAARVSMTSGGGSILGAGTAETAVWATELRMEAGGAIGRAAAPLSVAVDRIAASADGAGSETGIFIRQSGPVAVTRIDPVEVHVFAVDGSVASRADGAALAGLSAGDGGHLHFAADGGSISVEQAVAVADAGNIRIETTGDFGDVSLEADLSSGTGNLTILSAGDLTLAADAAIDTNSAGAILVRADGGALRMEASSRVRAIGSAVKLTAASSVTLGQVEADAVSVIAEEGSIFSALKETMNLAATQVRLQAGQAIGTAVQWVLTSATLLSATARGNDAVERGLYVRIPNSTVIGTVGFAGVEVLAGGSVGPVTDANQSGVEARNDGEVRLEATGWLEIADGESVRSDSGDIVLAATGDLRISTVVSDSGEILLSSGGAIVDNRADETPNLSTGGTAHLVASNGIGGIGAADLNTEVAALTALNTTAGLIVVRAVDGFEISAATTLTAGGVRNEAPSGSVLLAATVGHLVVNAPVFAAHGGFVLLDAEGVDADLTVHADVTAVNGAISLAAGRHLVIGAKVRAERGGTIDLRAVSGDLLLSPQATVQTRNAPIRLVAGGSAVLTGVDAGLADVSATALAGAILDGGDLRDRDVIAGGLRLSAAEDIGGEEDALDLKVATIAARTSSGSIFVSEANGIVIGTVPAVAVDRVNFDNTLVPVAEEGATSDLVAQGAGTVSLISEAGAILVNDGVLADGFGVRSAGGEIRLWAATNLVQNASIATAASGGIRMIAGGRTLTMADAVEATTDAGAIHYEADDDLRLSRLVSRSGTIRVEAGGKILDATLAETPNVTTGGHAIFSAGEGIGDVGAADININVGSVEAGNDVSGRIVLRETNGLVVTAGGIVNSAVGGEILLLVKEGQLRVDAPVAAAGDGDILLQVEGLLADLVSSGAVSSEGGHLTLLAPGAIRLEPGAALATAGAGTITLEAATGEIAMDGTAAITALDGDVQLTAATDLFLGTIQTLGHVALTTGMGSIYNNGTGITNVTADGVRLNASLGIGRLGATVDPVTVRADILTARATSGGIHLLVDRSVVIADVAVTTQRVNPDAGLTASVRSAQSDIATLSGNGSIVLRGTSPEVEISLEDGLERADGVAVGAHGTGNVHIGNATLLFAANSDVRSGRGHLSLKLNGGAITFGEGADLLTSGGGTLYVEAGRLIMHATTRFATDAGDINVVGADIDLGSIATLGNVAVTALDGSIRDTGDALPDVRANALILNASDGVGSLGTGSADPLEIQVGILSARGGAGGIAVVDMTDDLRIDRVAVTVAEVTPNGSTAVLSTGWQSDVLTVSGNGSIVIRVAEGSLALEDGTVSDNRVAVAAHGTGNVYLETLHTFARMKLNAGIASDAGNISLVAALEMQMAPGVSIETGGTGTIDLVSHSGFILMADTSRLVAAEGDIRLHAASDILVGGIRTGGNVSLISALASILDNGDSHIDVEAAGIRLRANTDIGILVPVGVNGGPNALEINAGILSAHTAVGDINLMESDGLVVGDVSVAVNRVGSDGATETVRDAVQSDLRTKGGHSSVVLRSLSGDLEFNDGTVLADGSAGADGIAVSAHGSGLILIETLGEESRVRARAGVVSTTGHITIVAGGSVEFIGGAGVSTGGNGSLFIAGASGDVALAGGRFQTFGGSIRLLAGGSIRLGELVTTGNVSLIAETGGIENREASDRLVADRLRLVAGTGIHIAGLEVNILSARSSSGPIAVYETDDLVIGDARASVARVNPDNTLTMITDATQSDVTILEGDGGIVIVTLEGDLILEDGTAAANNLSVSTEGAGDVSLKAHGNVDLRAGVRSGTGHVRVVGGGSLSFAPAADVVTGGDGAIYLEATTGSLGMDDRSLVRSGAGDIRLVAETDVWIGGIRTEGSVTVTAVNGSILDTGDFYTDLVADGAILVAGVGIGVLGAGADPLETELSRLAARAGGGGIHILEADDLAVDTVRIRIEGVDGADPYVAEGSDLVTTDGDGSIVIRTLAGSVLLQEGLVESTTGTVSADGKGNILIEANGETADIEVNATVRSGEGAILLDAARSVIFGVGGGIVTGGDGTIAVAAESADVRQAGGSRIVADAGDIALRAGTDVSLGTVVTGAALAIVAETGSILDNGDAAEILAADRLLLSAATGIGIGENAIDTEVGAVTAKTDSGGIFLLESDALTVGAVDVAVDGVRPDGTRVPGMTFSQANVSAGGSSPIVIRTLSGDLAFDAAIPSGTPAVAAAGVGNLLLQTLGEGTNLILNADVRSGGGHISLLAGGAVTFVNDARLATTGAGTINIEAAEGSVELDGGTVVGTGSGDIRIHAETDVRLGEIRTAGDVSLTAATGSIHGAGFVAASGLRMVAGVGVGFLDARLPTNTEVETLTVLAGTGGILISEVDGLTVGDVEATVQKVAPNGTLVATTDALQSDLRTIAGDQNIILRTQAGAIVLEDGTAAADGVAITAAGGGNILIETTGSDGRLFGNAAIRSGTGHITILAHKTATFGPAGDISTGGAGTIHLDAQEDILQADGSRFEAENGDIHLRAHRNLSLGRVGTAGNVVLVATTGSIFDNGDAEGEDVVADQLQIKASVGFGEAANPVETKVGTLSARAGSGGIFLLNTGDLAVGDTAATTGIGAFSGDWSAVTVPTQSDVRTLSGDGDIVIRTHGGSLALNDGEDAIQRLPGAVAAHGAGNILIEAGGIGSDIDVKADVRSDFGHVTIRAGRTVRLAAGVSVGTGTSDGESGTLFLGATAGSIEMGDGAFVGGNEADIRLVAGQDILLGAIETSGNVSLAALNGAISGNGDAATAIRASELSLAAGTGIGGLGEEANAIEISVDRLAVRAGLRGVGDVNLLNGRDLVLDAVEATVEQVGADGATTTVVFAAPAGVSSFAGSMVLRTVDTLTINGGAVTNGVFASRDILLEADDIAVNSRVVSGTGHVTLLSAHSVRLNAASGILASGPGSVLVEAAGGSIEMDDNSLVNGGNGNIRFRAAETVLLGGIRTIADVSLIAVAGSIRSAGNQYIDVQANALRLEAGDEIGHVVADPDGVFEPFTAPVRTAVTTMTARAENLVHLHEFDALIVDDVEVAVRKVNSDGSYTVVTDASQAGVRTLADGGDILIRTMNGDLTLKSGTPSNGGVVVAAGGGNIGLSAGGAESKLAIEGGVHSSEGMLSLFATGSVELGDEASIFTGGGGISVEGRAGSVLMADTSRIEAGTNVRLAAGETVVLGGVRAGAIVSIRATAGSILDGGDTYTNIEATELRAVAGVGIGALGEAADALETAVSIVAARGGSGGVHLVNVSGFSIGGTREELFFVDSSVEPNRLLIDEGFEGVATTDGHGSIVLRALEGGITVGGESLASETNGIAAHGGGNILVEALGAGGFVVLATDSHVRSDSGHLTVRAAGDVTLSGGALVATGGEGTVTLGSDAGSVSMAEGSRLQAADGDIGVLTHNHLLLAEIITGGNVSLTTTLGSILGNAEAPVNLVADGLRMVAGGGIGLLGEEGRPIRTTVTTVSARAGGGGISILETDALAVNDVEVTVQTVNADGTVTTTTDVAQSDVRTIEGDGSIVLRTLGGEIVLSDGLATADAIAVAAHGAGNVLVRAEASIVVNGGLASGTGHITVEAPSGPTGFEIDIGSDVATGGNGTISIFGDLVRQLPGTRISSVAGDIMLVGTNDIYVAGVVTGGNVALTSESGAVRSGEIDRETNISADRLVISAADGVGAAGGDIRTRVTTIAVHSSFGGVYLFELDGLTVGAVDATVQRVSGDGTVIVTSAEERRVVRAGGDRVVIRSLEGDIVLTENPSVVSVKEAGHILIQAIGAEGRIRALGLVSSETGHVTFQAGADIEIAGGVATGGTGTLLIEASTGSILVSSTLVAEAGDIGLRAGRDILLGTVRTDGNIAMIAEAGSIVGGVSPGVSAGGLLLTAGLAIGRLGAEASPLRTDVDTLTARGGAGGIHLLNTAAVAIDTVAVTVRQVSPDGGFASGWQAEQSGIATTVDHGTIVIRSGDGGIEVNAAVTAHGSGNVLIATADASDLNINAGIRSGSGHITLASGGSVAFDAVTVVTEGGTLNVEAANAVAMAGLVRFESGSGNIRIAAVGNVVVGEIRTTGDVSITSAAGSIFSGERQTENIREADAVRLAAAVGIGTFEADEIDLPSSDFQLSVATLSARAGAGGMRIVNNGTLTVGSVAVAVERVDAAGTTTVTDAAQADLRTTGEGSILLELFDGDLMLNDGSNPADRFAVVAGGTGNVRLATVSPGGQIHLNAGVSAAAGLVDVRARGDVVLASGARVRAGAAGTINLATTESILMSAAARIEAESGNIRLEGGNDLRLGGIETTGSVSLIATSGSIFGNSEAVPNVAADGLRLIAGIGIGRLGEGATPMKTSVNTLSARATSGGVNLLETNGLTIDDVAVTVSVVDRVGALGAVTDAVQSDVRTTAGNGSVVIRTLAGPIVLNDGTAPEDGAAVRAHGSGNVLIEAMGENGDLEINGDVISEEGSISLRGTGSLTFGGNVTLTSGGPDGMHFEVGNGSLTFGDGVLLDAGDGDIRLVAEVDVWLGGVRTTGNVSVIAVTGSILDNGNTHTDVVASGLRLVAGTGIGTLGDGANALDIDVTTVSARAGGGIHLHNLGALTLDAVEVTVSGVGPDGDVIAITDEAQSGLVSTGGGSIVVRTESGALTVNEGATPAEGVGVSANGNGHILLVAGGDASDLVLNAHVSSEEGGLTLVAGRSAILAAGVEIVAAGGGAATVNVETIGGSIVMEETSRIHAPDGVIRLAADTDVFLGELRATSAVVIAGTGSILDNGKNAVNIVAEEVILQAAVGIGILGAGADAIEVEVARLAASAGSGGVNLLESTDLEVSTVAVDVVKVGFDGLPMAAATTELSGVVTTSGNGSVVLRTSSGGIFMGTETTPGAIFAHGSGRILIEANGDAATVRAESGIRSTSGHITIAAASSVSLSGPVITDGGDIFMEAAAGAVDASGPVDAGSGNIRLRANGALYLRHLETTGDVSVIAQTLEIGGRAGQDLSLIAASGLRLEAQGEIRGLTEVDLLTAHSRMGDIDIRERDGLTIGTVAVAVNRVTADASSIRVVDGSQTGIAATGEEANVRIYTDAGDLTVGPGVGEEPAASATGTLGVSAARNVIVAGVLTARDAIVQASTGAILDTGDAAIDILAATLRLTAATGIGTLGAEADAIETRVGMLSATTSAGVIHIVEADGLVVGDADSSLVGLHADTLVLRTLDGDLVLSGDLPVSVDGDILLEAGGAEANLILDGWVATQTGHLSLIAADSVHLGSSAEIRATEQGSIDVEAGAGSIVMAAAGKFRAEEGDVRLVAALDVMVAEVETRGNIAITALAGSILDGDHGDERLDLRADGLRLNAGLGIGHLGEQADALEILVSTLSARAGIGGVHLSQTNPLNGSVDGFGEFVETALTIGDVGATVWRVTESGDTVEVSETVQSDVRTTVDGGSIQLSNDAGDLILRDGTAAADGIAVEAAGNGFVRLAASRVAGNIRVGAAIRSGSGEIALRAVGEISIHEQSGVFNGGGGSVSILGGSLAMADVSLIDAGSGGIVVDLFGDAVLGGLTTTGDVFVGARIGSIESAGGFHTDIVAGAAQLVAGLGIGIHGEDGQPILTDLGTLGASAGAGGIHLLNTGALLIGGETGLIASDHGAIVIRAHGDLTLNAGESADFAVSAGGGGNIRLEALEEGSRILINDDVRSGYGHLTLLAPGSISIAEGAEIVVGGFGTIFIESGEGTIAMAETSRVLAGGGDVRIIAREELLLSSVQTTGNLYIRAIRGSIVDQGDAHSDLAANGLFIIAGNGIGSAENPLEVAISRLSASAKGGGVSLVSATGFRVGEVAVTIRRINPSSSITAIKDEGTGVETIGGNGSILLRATVGHLVVDSGIAADGGGSVTLGTDVVGGILLNAPIRSASGDLKMDSAGWIQDSVTTGGPTLETAGAIRLAAESGIGETGSRAIETRSTALYLENAGDGSAYIRTDATVVLGGVSLAGDGSFDLNQTTGDLTVTGSVTTHSGSATIVSRGAVSLVGATVAVGGDLEVLARAVRVTETFFESTDGSTRLRGAELIEFDGASQLKASSGDLRLRSGEDIVIGQAVAGGLLELIAGGTIASALPGVPAGVLTAGHLRMRAGVDIGAPAAPIYFDAGRLDVDADGTVSIHSLGAMVIGRFGLAMESAPGEEIVLRIDGGDIGAVGGRLVDRGGGTLVLKSDNDVAINSVIVSENGSVRIEADRITSASESDAGRIEARNGSVTFVAEDGIGGTGSQAVSFHSPKVQATTKTGPLELNSVGSTTVFGDGLFVRDGAGALGLNLESGSLELLADVRHLGTGSVSLAAMLGAITMDVDARVSTKSGALGLAARDAIRLSRVETESGLVRLSSVMESIFGMTGLAGSAGANIVVTDLAPAPILDVAQRAFLNVLADKVTVNGFDFYRAGRSTIPVNLTFQ